MTDLADLHVPPPHLSIREELDHLPAAPGEPPARRRHDDGWLERWLDTCSDLARLQATNPMLDAVIDEIDGRRIRIGPGELGKPIGSDRPPGTLPGTSDGVFRERVEAGLQKRQVEQPFPRIVDHLDRQPLDGRHLADDGVGRAEPDLEAQDR